MTDPIRKLVFLIEPEIAKDMYVIDHQLGEDVIVQLHGASGRILKARMDITPSKVIIYFKSGVSERLKLVIIG